MPFCLNDLAFIDEQAPRARHRERATKKWPVRERFFIAFSKSFSLIDSRSDNVRTDLWIPDQ